MGGIAGLSAKWSPNPQPERIRGSDPLELHTVGTVLEGLSSAAPRQPHKNDYL